MRIGGRSRLLQESRPIRPVAGDVRRRFRRTETSGRLGRVSCRYDLLGQLLERRPHQIFRFAGQTESLLRVEDRGYIDYEAGQQF